MLTDAHTTALEAGPAEGIALLMLGLLLINYLIQRFLGSRLPYRGEISTLALSVTAFVLSVYLLLLCQQGEPLQVRGVFLLDGIGASSLPYSVGLGLSLDVSRALLAVLVMGLHVLFLLSISPALPTFHLPLQGVLQQASRCLLACLLILMASDWPLIWLGSAWGSGALIRMMHAGDFLQDLSPRLRRLRALGGWAFWTGTLLLLLQTHGWQAPLPGTTAWHPAAEASASLGTWLSHGGTITVIPLLMSLTVFALVLGVVIYHWLPLLLLAWPSPASSASFSPISWKYATLLGGLGVYTLVYAPLPLPWPWHTGIMLGLGALISLWAGIQYFRARGLVRMGFWLGTSYAAMGVIFSNLPQAKQYLAWVVLAYLIPLALMAMGVSNLWEMGHRLIQKLNVHRVHPQTLERQSLSPISLDAIRGFGRVAPVSSSMLLLSLGAVIGFPFLLGCPFRHLLLAGFSHLFQPLGLAGGMALLGIQGLLLSMGVGQLAGRLFAPTGYLLRMYETSLWLHGQGSRPSPSAAFLRKAIGWQQSLSMAIPAILCIAIWLPGPRLNLVSWEYVPPFPQLASGGEFLIGYSLLCVLGVGVGYWHHRRLRSPGLASPGFPAAIEWLHKKSPRSQSEA